VETLALIIPFPVIPVSRFAGRFLENGRQAVQYHGLLYRFFQTGVESDLFLDPTYSHPILWE
jgi:hypothetical protein